MTIRAGSDEYHITYGLHSGYPLCCVFRYVEEGKGGECPKCVEAGLYHELHRCSVDYPQCADYLELIDQSGAKGVHRFADADENDIAFGHTTDMGPKTLSALEERGYKLDKTEEQGEQIIHFYIRSTVAGG
jgi:hypothetical protein